MQATNWRCLSASQRSESRAAQRTTRLSAPQQWPEVVACSVVIVALIARTHCSEWTSSSSLTSSQMPKVSCAFADFAGGGISGITASNLSKQ